MLNRSRIVVLCALVAIVSASVALRPVVATEREAVATTVATKVLHIHVVSLGLAQGEDVMSVQLDIQIGEDGEDTIGTNLTPNLDLKTMLGTYKTALQLNQELVESVKDYLADEPFNIPTNAYLTTFLSGGYGALNLL